MSNEAAERPPYVTTCPNCKVEIAMWMKPPVLGAALRRVDSVRLQAAMKEAHGRRISLGETYAEAIARRYNAILAAEHRR